MKEGLERSGKSRRWCEGRGQRDPLGKEEGVLAHSLFVIYEPKIGVYNVHDAKLKPWSTW